MQRGPLGPTQLDALQRSRLNPEHLLSLGMYRRTIHVAHGLEEPPASSCGCWRTTLEGDFGQRGFPGGGLLQVGVSPVSPKDGWSPKPLARCFPHVATSFFCPRPH